MDFVKLSDEQRVLSSVFPIAQCRGSDYIWIKVIGDL